MSLLAKNFLTQKDKMLEKLVQANERIDDKACAFAQLVFKELHQVLVNAMKEQLPGGAYFSPTEDIRVQTKSVIPHNKRPERVLIGEKHVSGRRKWRIITIENHEEEANVTLWGVTVTIGDNLEVEEEEDFILFMKSIADLEEE
ncbi:Hypothetical predicted protein [Mytilus galloprovincialis]|uniref:Uncharacterized protein n=1 Tax=Mytilus galloprovincialis TaxID=29158 RepID=A0A8B6E6F4_MYTGA|nr:Hypothetical predicted protein [Mytilus galloprovincialis]